MPNSHSQFRFEKYTEDVNKPENVGNDLRLNTAGHQMLLLTRSQLISKTPS
jgi:hypothetical protein